MNHVSYGRYAKIPLVRKCERILAKNVGGPDDAKLTMKLLTLCLPATDDRIIFDCRSTDCTDLK